MSKKFNIAVVGATGNVGRKVISILAEREFPVDNLYALASNASKGKKISFGEDAVLTVESLDNFDFKKANIVFSCVSSDIVKTFYKKAIAAGCSIIDKSSLFRMDEDVPLIVPEVNEHLLINNANNNRIVASPNCCVIPLVTVLSPLHSAAKIKRIVVSTYQSVSGAGKEFMDELYNQTKSSFMPDKSAPAKFEKQIAFNIIPKIDKFLEDGSTGEEQKIIEETKKILGANIGVSATCVRVPVFIGHSLSVNVEFEGKLSQSEAIEILEESEGIAVVSDDSELKYITPVEAAGEDLVYVSRIREDKSRPNCLNLWIVSDNLRKGAATNAVQIAELIARITD
jgi:aspartate-semialdehyde dehydrogenase